MNTPRPLYAWAVALLALALCGSCSEASREMPKPAAEPVAAASSAAAPVATPAADGAREAAKAAPPPPPGGVDFSKEARQWFRVVACGGSEPLPGNVDLRVIDEHCRLLQAAIDRYRTNYLQQAAPFFASVRPKDTPTTVVYPFGGGDLLSALTTYPDATLVTTMSLELAGDPGRLPQTTPEELREHLARLRRSVSGLLYANDSTSESLKTEQQGPIPGQLAFFLIGLAVHGYQPVSLRYVEPNADGSLRYLEAEDFRRVAGSAARPRLPSWNPPDFSEAYAHAELTFVHPDHPGAIRVHRHFAVNLAALPKASRLLAHLDSIAPFAAMTKAASYCLWNPLFSRIRDGVLKGMVVMVSDSTGIPPEAAAQAGFEQETYGSFSGSFLPASEEINKQFRDLWEKNPTRRMPFRYGYVDSEGHCHLLVTRRPETAP